MSPSLPGAKVRRSSGAEEGSAVSNDAYSRAGRQTSGMAVGFILFAAIMMIMVGHLPGVAGAHRHLRERVLCGHPQLPVPVGRHHLGLDPPDPRAAGGLRR